MCTGVSPQDLPLSPPTLAFAQMFAEPCSAENVRATEHGAAEPMAVCDLQGRRSR